MPVATVYVYPSTSVPLCVSALVTTTSTAPAAWAGVVQVICDDESTLTPVAGLPPNVTVAPARKLVPVMVTEVPPAVVPEAGETDETVGAGVV